MTKLAKKIPLMECFGPTVQGEGAACGQLTHFLRFGLCSYKCVMCDSMHSVDPRQVRANAEWLTQDQIADKLLAHHIESEAYVEWVTLSGGDPCVHDLSHLVDRLQSAGFKIAVETQGAQWQDWLAKCDLVTISPKGPGMVSEGIDREGVATIVRKLFDVECAALVAIKYVIFNDADVQFAREMTNLLGEASGYCLRRDQHFYLSQGNSAPPGGQMIVSDDDLKMALTNDFPRLIDLVAKEPLLAQMKLLPQLHVWIWGNKAEV